MTAAVVIVLVLLFLVVLFLISAIKVAREYERGIVFRLGRLLPEPKGPGLFILIPVVDRMVKVDLRTITPEGEFKASERLRDAALVIEQHPIALQLRYLQTLLDLGSSQSTTIVFPAPIELIKPFLDRAGS